MTEQQGLEAALTARYLNPDSDGNGLPDVWEILHFGNTGVVPGADADNDGLTNLREYQLGTNPRRADTDSDGLPDGWEDQFGSNPLVNDSNADPDGDGLSNLIEYVLGSSISQPATPDTTGLLQLRVYSPRK